MKALAQMTTKSLRGAAGAMASISGALGLAEAAAPAESRGSAYDWAWGS